MLPSWPVSIVLIKVIEEEEEEEEWRHGCLRKESFRTLRRRRSRLGQSESHDHDSGD